MMRTTCLLSLIALLPGWALALRNDAPAGDASVREQLRSADRALYSHFTQIEILDQNSCYLREDFELYRTAPRPNDEEGERLSYAFAQRNLDLCVRLFEQLQKGSAESIPGIVNAMVDSFKRYPPSADARVHLLDANDLIRRYTDSIAQRRLAQEARAREERKVRAVKLQGHNLTDLIPKTTDGNQSRFYQTREAGRLVWTNPHPAPYAHTSPDGTVTDGKQEQFERSHAGDASNPYGWKVMPDGRVWGTDGNRYPTAGRLPSSNVAPMLRVTRNADGSRTYTVIGNPAAPTAPLAAPSAPKAPLAGDPTDMDDSARQQLVWGNCHGSLLRKIWPSVRAFRNWSPAEQEQSGFKDRMERLDRYVALCTDYEALRTHERRLAHRPDHRYPDEQDIAQRQRLADKVGVQVDLLYKLYQRANIRLISTPTNTTGAFVYNAHTSAN